MVVKMKKSIWGASSIIIDTREQKPYEFTGHPTVVTGLKTGDYSVTGMEHLVVVERKSQADYWGCLGKSRARFVKELERMKEIPWSLVVVEASLQQVQEGYFFYNGDRSQKSRIPGITALNSSILWTLTYPSIRFMFCGGREEAEWLTLNWLQMALRYQRHREKETDGK